MILDKIVQEEVPIPEQCSEDFRDFLKRCLKKDPQLRFTAKDLMDHPWIKKRDMSCSLLPKAMSNLSTDEIHPNDISLIGNAQVEVMLKQHKPTSSREDIDFSRRKEIDRKRIILKKCTRNRPFNGDPESRTFENDLSTRVVKDKSKRLSQEEINSWMENNNISGIKYEESKIRHKKSPAMLNNQFLDTIKGFSHSNRNDNSKKIKYPGNGSGQNNMIFQNTANIEHLATKPMNHQESNQNRGVPPGVARTDLRREDPLMQGFNGSNKGSNGSGGIPNPHLQMNETDKDIITNPSYHQIKGKNEDRNALSQD